MGNLHLYADSLIWFRLHQSTLMMTWSFRLLNNRNGFDNKWRPLPFWGGGNGQSSTTVLFPPIVLSSTHRWTQLDADSIYLVKSWGEFEIILNGVGIICLLLSKWVTRCEPAAVNVSLMSLPFCESESANYLPTPKLISEWCKNAKELAVFFWFTSEFLTIKIDNNKKKSYFIHLITLAGEKRFYIFCNYFYLKNKQKTTQRKPTLKWTQHLKKICSKEHSAVDMTCLMSGRCFQKKSNRGVIVADL